MSWLASASCTEWSSSDAVSDIFASDPEVRARSRERARATRRLVVWGSQIKTWGLGGFRVRGLECRGYPITLKS